MTESAALLGYGSIFQIEDPDDPGTYVSLAEVYSITPPGISINQIDITHHKSPGRRREFDSGFIDSGECTLEMNYIPASASDILLLEIVNTPVGSSRTRNCRLVFSNDVYVEFSANLMTYEQSIANDDRMTATATWRINGALTYSYQTQEPTAYLIRARFSGSGSLSARPIGPQQMSAMFAGAGSLSPSIPFDVLATAPGIWLDPSDLSTMWQDAAATVPVTGDGNPVRLIQDKSGNGNHYLAPSMAARPTLRIHAPSGVARLVFDGVDDRMDSVLNAGHATTGHIASDEFDLLMALKVTVSNDDAFWSLGGGLSLALFIHDAGGTRGVLTDNSVFGFNFIGNQNLIKARMRTVSHFRLDGGFLDMSCDARSATQVTIPGGNIVAGYDTILGRIGGRATFQSASFYGLIGRKTVFSASQLVGLKTHLNSKCTIPLNTGGDDEVHCIVTVGESNAGGIVAVPGTLTANDLSVRPDTLILHNTNLVFEPLQIGVNCTIGHALFTDNTHAGLEIGLADIQEDNVYGEFLYYIKNGNGGARTTGYTPSLYDAGNSYFANYATRWAAAIDHFEDNDLSPTVHVWMSIGINDMVTDGQLAAYMIPEYVIMLNSIQEIHRSIFVDIYLGEFSDSEAYAATIGACYAPAIALVPNNDHIFILDVGDPELDVTTTHWTATGFRTIAQALTDEIFA